MRHERFHYPDLDSLRQRLRELGCALPLADSTDVLFSGVEAQGFSFPNRIVIQPMEGCDSLDDGAPGELTLRRYRRFAASGAGTIWLEAVAIVPEGRAKPHQLSLSEETLPHFQRMLEEIREISLRQHGFAPKIIIQAAHSGRYSNPRGYSEPLILYNNPLFEGDRPIAQDRILSDDYLKRLEERFGWAAAMAQRAGFDGIDVKACHRYLLSESLSAYTREGPYGGCFENRTRLLCNSLRAAGAATGPDFLVTTRLNVYDGFVYPYGFGVSPSSGTAPDLSEPVKLAALLQGKLDIRLLNVTAGNPYVNPHVNRPYDSGGYIPDEHPLEGVSRLMHCVETISRSCPRLAVVGSGFSYLRRYAPNLAAGMIERGGCTLAGFGRLPFAYPAFPGDLRRDGAIDGRKCCVTCGGCAKLLRAGEPAGCVVHDREVYRNC